MDQVNEIKKHIDIVDFIGRYISLKKAGRNFKSPCPFHNEKSPSFIVSPERQIWHCFGSCGEGGDIIKFLMKWDNIGFHEALTILAKQAGITLKEFSVTDTEYKEKEQLYGINALAADFYQYLLEKHRFGQSARDYIESRGVSDKLARLYYLGYAPLSWDSLVKFLNKKGYRDDIIIKAGLGIKTKRGTLIDRFRGRLMFPLYDIRGNVVGFSGRILIPSDKEAKYVNSPETPVYRKREHLFGLYQAKDAIKKSDEILLVEGEFDAISCHKHSYTHVAAIKGSALTPDHCRLIKRFTNRIVFALDTDKAGIEAAKRGIEAATEFEFEIRVVELNEDKDPADSLEHDPSFFKSAYKHKVSIYSFIVEQAIKNNDVNDIYGKKRVAEEVLPYLLHEGNPIVRDYQLGALAQRLALPPESITKAVYELRKKRKKLTSVTSIKKGSQTRPREEILEDYLLALLIQTDKQHFIAQLVAKNLDEKDFYSPSTFKLIKVITESINAKADSSQKTVEGSLPSELIQNYNRAYLIELPNDKTDYEKEAEKAVSEIKRLALKRKLHDNPDSEVNELDKEMTQQLKNTLN